MFCAFTVSLSQACAAVWEANLESFSPDAGRLLCERVDREPDSLFCVQMSGGTIDDLAPGTVRFPQGMELFPEECRDAGRLEFSVEARAAEAEGDGLGGAVLPEPVQG